jgi:hypothetical protein
MASSRFSRLAAVCVAGVGFAAFAATPAHGDASGKASCIGIEASSVSPPGSSDEFSGGMSQLVSAVKEEAGGKLGSAIGPFAKLHAGSHEACDAAAGG